MSRNRFEISFFVAILACVSFVFLVAGCTPSGPVPAAAGDDRFILRHESSKTSYPIYTLLDTLTGREYIAVPGMGLAEVPNERKDRSK